MCRQRKKFFSFQLAVPFAALALLATGCSTARLISTKPGDSGVVAVNPPNDASAREKAQSLMAATCGSKRVEITEEGEQVIGSVSRSQGNAQPYSAGIFGSGITGNSQTQTENATEWRIHFKCVSK